MTEVIGKPIDRVDGRLKVTGAARYSAEFPLPKMAHGFCVLSTIAKGKIQDIDTSKAEKAPGVLAVITHKNAVKLHKIGDESQQIEDAAKECKPGEKNFVPLQDETIYYDGQHIGIVVAETFEQARDAADLIKIDYATEKPLFEMEQALDKAYPAAPSFGRELQIKRGDATVDAEVKVEQKYSTPIEHHNPMEPHATIADWKEDQLTLYDSTQWVLGTRNGLAQILGLPTKKIRVVTLYVGGGFGSKGFVWSHPVLAAIASKKVGRPVKVVLTRQQMFTTVGHRNRTLQEVALGADKSGKLQFIRHHTTCHTSMVEEFVEPSGLSTRILYACPNLDVSHKLINLNVGSPTPTRAPGEATGTFALESAMDELAYALKMDPIALRLANHADVDPQSGKAWSSKFLKECYEKGAKLIGWDERRAETSATREGNYLIGYGMATATYPANRAPASAKVQIHADGHAVVASCTQDIGTGTYTILAQIAAETLGIPVEKIEVKLGDSNLPKAPVSGGSQTAASVGPAVRAAALTARSKVIALASNDKESPLHGADDDAIAAEKGRLFLKSDTAKGHTYTELLKRHNTPFVEAECTTEASTRESAGEDAGKKPKEKSGGCPAAKSDEEVERSKYSFHSFGAQFAKVRVDPVLGIVRVIHLASVIDAGRIMNLKTAENQIAGGMVFGLGMALLEHTVMDPNRGRIITRDLANYLVPVNADVPKINVEFIGKPDSYISPIGGRGIGEIGITGVVAAIANAVYNATGKRVRDLPITPEKLIT